MSSPSAPTIAIGGKLFTAAELAAANDQLRSAIDSAHRDFNDEVSPFYQNEARRSAVVLAANQTFQYFVGNGILHVQVHHQREAPVEISLEPLVGKGGGQPLRQPRRLFRRSANV